MYLAWTKHIKDPDEKVRFENSIKGSKDVLERLSQLLSEEERGLDRSETDVRTYDLPNWDYKQAHKNGFRECLYIVQKLINLDQQEK